MVHHGLRDYTIPRVGNEAHFIYQRWHLEDKITTMNYLRHVRAHVENIFYSDSKQNVGWPSRGRTVLKHNPIKSDAGYSVNIPNLRATRAWTTRHIENDHDATRLYPIALLTPRGPFHFTVHLFLGELAVIREIGRVKWTDEYRGVETEGGAG